MKEYKRLTTYEGGDLIINCKNCEYDEEHNILCTDYHCIDALKTRLAELEDKIERGELVENTVITYINMARTNGKTLIDKALKYDTLKAKIENGTLIELPCKVGDTVYIPYKFRNKNGVFETKIEEIRIEKKHIFFWTKPLYTNNSVRVKYLGWKKPKDFNKTWFLTKAEAEAKLKELKNER